MITRAMAWGLGASLGLAGFYVSVLAWAGGWQHVADQARQDWWLLVPIVAVLGIQVAAIVELRHRHRVEHLGVTSGTGGAASAVGMLACCAHHIAEILPIIGTAGVASSLFEWRIPLMAGGLAVSVAVAAVGIRRLASAPRGGTPCAASA